ncbi:TetR/AcrR family transcriptional regulator [Reinekea blandensis]|nr:TetR/AcrR family transcriptional regulator [Reinekea blandensis]
MTENITPPRRGRPPKRRAGTDDTRALLIRSGLELLTEQGFVASGLDPILKRVGVPKGSFYYYFDSKEAFGLEVLAAYDRYFAAKLDKHLSSDTLPPLQRLQAFVEDAKQGMIRHDFRRGCLVGNLEQEVAYLPERFRPRLLSIYQHWQSKVAACLVASQQTGDVTPTMNCNELAEQFWIGWEGAINRSRLIRDTQPLDRFLNHFIQLISPTHQTPV